MAKKGEEQQRPIIIKKIKKGDHGHHGGAWKVAYADFVTAMMAFFLLMWLLNATTKEQKEGISDYFNPTVQVVSASTSGSGGVMGGLTVSPDGAKQSDTQPFIPSTPTETAPAKTADELSDEALEQEKQKREEAKFDEIKKQIQEAMDDPELKELAKNLKIDMTPEGLRIQIVDQEGESMFPSGSAQPFAKTEKLMAKVAEIIKSVPNQISVRGHTDAAPYSDERGYTNWELSSDRANSSRRVLLDNGVPMNKVANVVGKADTDHFIADNPMDPQNRRISIILLRDSLTREKGGVNSTNKVGKASILPDGPAFRPTQGTVNFP
jgi:chemotaxis protein MotB